MPDLRFQPINSEHSIEDFFLGIRFGGQLTESTFVKTIVSARSLAVANNLPAENQQANLMVALDPVAGMQTRSTAGFGTHFQRFTSAGTVEEELRLERNLIGYRTGSYDRWRTIVEKLETLVLPLAQQYAAEASILDSVVLQYVDRFTANETQGVDWSELFCHGSPWVASGIISTTTAWHSHTGRFEEAGDVKPARRLINVNVDVGEPVIRPGTSSPQSLAILTLCTDQFIRPGVNPFVIDNASFVSDMRARFDALHDRAKAILREVLSDAYLDRIAMPRAGTQS